MAPQGQTGVYTGLYYFASSVAAIVSPPLLGALIDAAGYAYMFAYASACFVLALVFILNVKEFKPHDRVNPDGALALDLADSEQRVGR